MRVKLLAANSRVEVYLADKIVEFLLRSVDDRVALDRELVCGI